MGGKVTYRRMGQEDVPDDREYHWWPAGMYVEEKNYGSRSNYRSDQPRMRLFGWTGTG